MFVVVYSIQGPKGFEGPTCCQQDFVSTGVHGYKLGDVIDAAFVSDPHAIFQRAVLCDFFLAEDWKCRALLCDPDFTSVYSLSLQRRGDNGAFVHRPLLHKVLNTTNQQHLKTNGSTLGNVWYVIHDNN